MKPTNFEALTDPARGSGPIDRQGLRTLAVVLPVLLCAVIGAFIWFTAAKVEDARPRVVAALSERGLEDADVRHALGKCGKGEVGFRWKTPSAKGMACVSGSSVQVLDATRGGIPAPR